jgi:hypothetical protein
MGIASPPNIVHRSGTWYLATLARDNPPTIPDRELAAHSARCTDFSPIDVKKYAAHAT